MNPRWLLCLLCLPLQDLGDEVVNDLDRVAIKPPKGWKQEKAGILLFSDPSTARQGMAVGSFPTVSLRTADEILAPSLDRIQKAGGKLLPTEDVVIAGFKGRLAIISDGDGTLWDAVIPVNPREHLRLTVTRPGATSKEGRALFDTIAGSVRRTSPSWAADDATITALKGLRFADAQMGEFFTRAARNGKTVGRERRLLKAATVNGKEGWHYEFEAEAFAGDGTETFKIVTKGDVATGGGWITEQLEESAAPKDGKPHQATATMTLDAGRCTVKGEVDGAKVNLSFEVTGPCYPWHLVEAVFGQLAVAGMKKATVQMLYPLFDHPTFVVGEMAPLETMKLPSGTRKIRMVFLHGRSFALEENGALWELTVTDTVISRRCTREEWEKAR